MIFDSVMLAAIAREMEPLVGARVREVWTGHGTATRTQSAEARAVFMQLGSPADGATLLIDTNPQSARLHLPGTPPHGGVPTPFSDVLRRTLRGARLASIFQPDFDRVLHLHFETRNTIGNLARYTLIAEIMDRRSNAILIDENGVILDALKRLPPFLNRARTILPHRAYEPPPGARRDPRAVTDWDAELLDKDWRTHLREFHGFPPLLMRTLEANIALGATPALALTDFFARVENAKSQNRAWLCNGQAYPLALNDACEPRSETLSELIENLAQVQEHRTESATRWAALRTHLSRLEARIAAQRTDLERARAHAADSQLWQEQGNLVLAHLREVGEAARQGQKTVELGDGLTTHQIAIEPKWPPADNATRLFNRARRARKLAEAAPARESELDAEAARLLQWRARLEAATESDLEQLEEEFGLEAKKDETKAPSRTRQQAQQAQPGSKLRRAEIGGWACFMGRSAEENQLLLSKVASSSDIWLHLRGRPSAHVIIKNQKGKDVPPTVLDEAARWLATTSLGQKTAHSGAQVEVLYTAVKWVRAIKGAPGKVTLQRAQTRLVRL